MRSVSTRVRHRGALLLLALMLSASPVVADDPPDLPSAIIRLSLIHI